MHAEGVYYHQGYLSTHHQRVVRVRTIGQRGVLTIKGASMGASRDEYEYDIPFKHAEEMLGRLCEQPTIEKHRFTLSFKSFVWEVDEFHGENEGLVVAEIELKSEDEDFEKPDWIGEEVTADSRYFNANLINYPYCKWLLVDKQGLTECT
jgi:adenylate cyclase